MTGWLIGVLVHRCRCCLVSPLASQLVCLRARRLVCRCMPLLPCLLKLPVSPTRVLDCSACKNSWKGPNLKCLPACLGSLPLKFVSLREGRFTPPGHVVIHENSPNRTALRAGDVSFKFLTYQLPTVGYWPTVAMTGNGELGFDSGEGT